MRGPADEGCQGRFGSNAGSVAPPSGHPPRSRAPPRVLGTCWPHVEGMGKLECGFRQEMRGCSLFHTSIPLPTLVPPLSMRRRARRWRGRAGNALKELSSLQHPEILAFLEPYDAVRIAQECISSKDAPRKVGQGSAEQNPSPLNFIQSCIALKVFRMTLNTPELIG